MKTVKDMTNDNQYNDAVLKLGGKDSVSSSKTRSTVIDYYSNPVKELNEQKSSSSSVKCMHNTATWQHQRTN